MRNELQLMWESLNPSKMSLNDIYGDLEDVDESEALYHAVDPEMGDIPLDVITLSTDQLKKLTTYNDDTTVWDAYVNFAGKDQKKIVKDYIRTRLYKDTPIVVNMNTAIDGYHRIIAAIYNKDSLQAPDISDLPE
jgi:hypothetical protein